MGKRSSSKPRIGDVKIESKTAKIHQKNAADVKKKADVNIKTAASSYNKQEYSNIQAVTEAPSHPAAPLVGTPVHLVELAPNVPETSLNNPVNQGSSQRPVYIRHGLNGDSICARYTASSSTKVIPLSAAAPPSQSLNVGSGITSEECIYANIPKRKQGENQPTDCIDLYEVMLNKPIIDFIVHNKSPVLVLVEFYDTPTLSFTPRTSFIQPMSHAPFKMTYPGENSEPIKICGSVSCPSEVESDDPEVALATRDHHMLFEWLCSCDDPWPY